MKNLKSSDGYFSSVVTVMKLCFMALSIVSVPVFVKPAFVASYEFFSAVFPRVRETFSAWLTPTVLYVLVNFIILAILANSRFQHKFDISGRSLEEHNPSAVHQKQQQEEPIYEEESTERSGITESGRSLEEHNPSAVHPSAVHQKQQQEEPIYEEESTERSGITESGRSLEEHNPSAVHQKQQQEEPIYEEESTKRCGITELEEAEVNSVARPERIRTPDLRRLERPLATSRFNANYKKPASSKSAAEAKSLGVSRSKKKADTLEATWKAITEGRGPPLTRHLRKSDTWETVHRGDATEAASRDSSSSSSSAVFRKSDTWSNGRNRTENLSGKPELGAGLRKDPSLNQDELNKRVEAFIARMNNEMKLQREESLARYMEMVNRGASE